MSPDEWRKFLLTWSDDWLSRDKSLTSSARKTRWLGSRPATEKQISQLEKRIGYRLPPSYRNFLLTSNGWSRTTELVQRVRPVAKIDWLETEEPAMLDVWASEPDHPFDGVAEQEYYSYDGRPLFLREHLRSSLLIADPVDGDSLIYLLNPLVVAEDGEWEAWRFANWIPGAERFPSFALLMQAEYDSFRRAETRFGPYDHAYAPDRPRHPATRIGKGRAKPRRLTIPETIAQLESPERKSRLDAANSLLREFRPHDPNNERPELVEPLAQILGSKLEVIVRSAAAAMLGSYGDTNAICPLINALADPEVATTAIDALHYLSLYMRDDRIGDAAAHLMRSSKEHFFIERAIWILKELADPRLAELGLWLLDHAHEIEFRVVGANDPSFAIAHFTSSLQMQGAFAFAEFAEPPTKELVARLSSDHPGIRAAAVAALRQDLHRSLLLKDRVAQLLDDADPSVKGQAEMTLRFLEPLPPVEISAEQMAKVLASAEAQLKRAISGKTNRF